MNIDELVSKLKDRKSPEHSAILNHVRNCISRSRSDMAKNYSTWDHHDATFRSRRPIDKEDVAANKEGKPTKMIVPLTYSQIMTYVAFSVMSVTQNRRFYELEPTGPEDNVLSEPMELILERDLRRNTWSTFLVQFFLDVARFSLGVAEVCYKEDYRYIWVDAEKKVEGPFGTSQTVEAGAYQQVPTFIGNRIYSVSPYRFYPDTSLPLTRFQEGEFCGSEDVFSLSSLRAMGDYVFNLDSIPKFTEEGYKQRRTMSRVDLGPMNRENPNLGSSTEKDVTTDEGNMMVTGPVTVTKVVLQVVPKHFKINGDTPLGPEGYPLRFVCWYANDSTIIKFEPAEYLHGQYPYMCGQYLADQHQVINESLAEVCEQITTLVTWKINAQITSQRSSINGKIAVDPAGVDVRTLSADSPFIYLKKNASQTGVDRYLKQFVTADPTQNTMKDVGDLDGLLEKVTGLSSQMQGQYSSGRRSATQDRVVAQGAGARGKTTLSAIWDTAFEPLGKQLIANNRQEMDLDTFKRVMGTRKWPTNPQAQPQMDATGQPVPVPYTVEEIFTLFKADALTIATSEDFFVFDGTLPSEKAFLAQSLQEIMMEILANPQVAPMFGFDAETLRALFEQIYLLRGVTPARLPTSTPTMTPREVLHGPPALPSSSTSGDV